MSERDEFEKWVDAAFKADPLSVTPWAAWQAARATQAVSTLMDERRRAAAKAMMEIFLGCPPHREPGQLDLQAVDAVARIILSAPQSSPDPKEPEHAHDWRFSLQDHVYKCDCGATRGDYPFGAASFKD